MTIRLARRHSNIERALQWGGACLLVYTSALAQGRTPPQVPSASQKNEGQPVVGCLAGTPGAFTLSDSEGNVYGLTGRTSGLEKYAGDEISVQGTKDESTQTLEVSSFKEIFRAPGPRLSSSFSNRSNWGTQTNRKFGIKFALPRFPNSTAASGPDTMVVATHAYFAAVEGTVTLAWLDIPAGIYPDTNFIGASFAIFVNPQITNRQSCEQFGGQSGEIDPQSLSSRTINGVRYAELTEREGAAGKFYSGYSFHSFQNNLCYELSFALGMHNPEIVPCTVSVMGEKDYLNVIESLAGRVSFFPPTTAE
ncbi:MAG: hypothetical protein WBQ08_06000 [Candidatus Sulfotelmatobacter sp.]